MRIKRRPGQEATSDQTTGQKQHQVTEAGKHKSTKAQKNKWAAAAPAGWKALNVDNLVCLLVKFGQLKDRRKTYEQQITCQKSK